MVTLGLLFSSLGAVFGAIGFLGGIYYLFAALEVVKPVSYDGDLKVKIEELQAELDKLEAITPGA